MPRSEADTVVRPPFLLEERDMGKKPYVFPVWNKRRNRHRAGSTDALLYLPIDEGVTLTERLYRYYGIRIGVALRKSDTRNAPFRIDNG